MSALDQISTARDESFAARIMMVAFAVAQDVSTEGAGVAMHTERLAYAKQISNGTDKAPRE